MVLVTVRAITRMVVGLRRSFLSASTSRATTFKAVPSTAMVLEAMPPTWNKARLLFYYYIHISVCNAQASPLSKLEGNNLRKKIYDFYLN